MGMTWITLVVVVIMGITKLLTYLLGDKRKLTKLRARVYEIEKEMRTALAKRDTVRISALELELKQLRQQIKNINAK